MVEDLENILCPVIEEVAKWHNLLRVDYLDNKYQEEA